jgi:hypothetical protein
MRLQALPIQPVYGQRFRFEIGGNGRQLAVEVAIVAGWTREGLPVKRTREDHGEGEHGVGSRNGPIRLNIRRKIRISR